MKILDEGCYEVGVHLEKLKDVIIDHWIELVKISVPVAREESRYILKDHMGEIIDNLILLLKRNELNEIELGKAHGMHRLTYTRFSLQDIQREYSLLRESLIDYLYPMGNFKCAKLLHRYIDIIARNSTSEFLKHINIDVRIERPDSGSELFDLKEDTSIHHPVIS